MRYSIEHFLFAKKGVPNIFCLHLEQLYGEQSNKVFSKDKRACFLLIGPFNAILGGGRNILRLKVQFC